LSIRFLISTIDREERSPPSGVGMGASDPGVVPGGPVLLVRRGDGLG
jgi:hypothetical protein